MSTSSCLHNAEQSLSAVTKYPIGLGTLMMDKTDIKQALQSAIVDHGYRRIDCAPVYFNEDVVGDALYEIVHQKQKQATRSDLLITSKLPSPFHTNVESAVRKTLNDLRLDYLDLYLVHWPVAFFPVPIDPSKRGWDNEDIDESDNGKNIDTSVSIHDTWKQMEAVQRMGLVRNIGVSNFPIILLHELLSKATIPPAVNQCESHPYLQQHRLVEYCHKRNVHFQAYSALGTPGYKEEDEPVVLDDPILQKIAKTHNVTPAQICLSWAVQRGTTVVAKSVSPEHQNDNMAALQVRLSDEEMEEIASIDRGYRFFRPEDWWGELAMAVFD